MNEKTYAVITQAPREYLSADWGKFSEGVHRVPYEYRHGAVGLIHPLIGEEFGKLTSRHFYPDRSRDGGGCFLPEEGDVLVLLHSEKLGRYSGGHRDTPKGFFVAYFNPREYTTLRGRRLPAVQNGVRPIYAQHNFLIPLIWEQMTGLKKEAALDEIVRQHWQMLEAFNPTTENISRLPLEISSRPHVTDEELEEYSEWVQKEARRQWQLGTKPPYSKNKLKGVIL